MSYQLTRQSLNESLADETKTLCIHCAWGTGKTHLWHILMAWNTTHMQRALENIEASRGQPIATEQLRRIAPTHIEGINLRGTFNFPVSLYAKWILPSIAADNPISSTSRSA